MHAQYACSFVKYKIVNYLMMEVIYKHVITYFMSYLLFNTAFVFTFIVPFGGKKNVPPIIAPIQRLI